MHGQAFFFKPQYNILEMFAFKNQKLENYIIPATSVRDKLCNHRQ